MSKKDTVRIAVAGHANTGKTTLIRTLLKSPVGKVEDRANVTQVASDHKFREFEGLQAVFIDTPGFQSAGELKLLFAIRERDPSFPLPDDIDEEEFRFDQRAYDAVRSSDAVIYVASLEVVPDRSHSREIELVKSAQHRVIGLLNKGRAMAKSAAKKKAGLENRIQLWQEIFKKHGIERVVTFDAHWDKPAKTLDIYNSIESVLDSEKLESFRSGVAKFEERQRQIQSLACQKIAECVTICYQTRETESKESEHAADHRGTSENIAKNAAYEASNKKITDALSKFFRDITDIFRIAAKSPTLTAEEVETEHYKITDTKQLIANAVKVASAGSTGGAGIGAAVGALVAGLLSGGLGAGAGALLGAKIGSIIGGAVGAVGGAYAEIADTHKVILTESSLYQIENICLSAVWAISHHGYGFRAEIEENQIRDLDAEVEKINQGPFKIVPFDSLVKKYELILERINSLKD